MPPGWPHLRCCAYRTLPSMMPSLSSKHSALARAPRILRLFVTDDEEEKMRKSNRFASAGDRVLELKC